MGNEQVLWYDLDLPEVMRARERFFQETERYRFIRSSVLDLEWMDAIDRGDGTVLFIAEGLLMYLREEEVRELVIALQDRFPGSELACEVASSFVVRTLNRKIWKRKFQRDHRLGEEVTFLFGIDEGRDLERWHEGIELLDEWTYFDDHERKMGWMRLLGRFERMRKAQWVVHYVLH